MRSSVATTMKVVFLFCFVLYVQAAPGLQTYQGKVVAVIDGDTIGVLHDGKEQRIRLNGIDAPEKSQAFGMKAKEFTATWLFDKTVKVVPKEFDRYGRLVADIYIDAQNTHHEFGAWFNKMIVASGLAWHYKKYSDSQELANAEALAHKAKIGLWVDPAPVAPWEYRNTTK